MKPRIKFLTITVATLLVLQSISTLAARRHVNRAITAQTANDEETFVITRNANGKTVCRIATAQEHDQIVKRDRNGKFKLIYGGAPKKAPFSFSTTWIEPTTGLALQPSAGLHIVLHATTQLDQNTQAKNAFIVAANRWEAIIATPITVVIDVDFGTTFFGTPYPSAGILGATGSSQNTGPFSDLRQHLISGASNNNETQLYN